jgi:hypothetical protein
MTSSLTTAVNTHSNSFSVSTNSFAVIYEYDQLSTQSFTNKNFLCSSNRWCVALGYPVNWIIEYVNTGTFPTTISSSFAFTNGIYAASFLGNVRVFHSNMSTIYKSTFTYTYSPRGMTGYNFWFK